MDAFSAASFAARHLPSFFAAACPSNTARRQRRLLGAYLCWACRDELDEYGFYEDRSCGQEGGAARPARSIDKAEDALRRMYDVGVVRGDDVLAGIFSIEQG